MPFRISGKNLDVGDALRERINDRVAEAMGKYFDGGYSGHVTSRREGFGFRTECAVHLNSKITLHAEGMAADAYASADQAAIADREAAAPLSSPAQGSSSGARRRPRRGRCARATSSPRRSTKARPRSTASRRSSSPNPPPVLKRLSVSDAVTELDMTGVPVVVFRHAAHGGINVVYRRADGHFGWIDPPAAAAAECPLTPAAAAPYGPPPLRRMIPKNGSDFRETIMPNDS